MWMDNKEQILEKFVLEFPTKMQNYHELFVGGGSVLLAALYQINNKKIAVSGKIYAYDINNHLITMFKNIQSDYLSVYNELDTIFDEFNTFIGQQESGKCDTTEYSLKRISNKHTNVENSGIKPSPQLGYLQYKERYYYWIRHEYNELDSLSKSTPRGTAMFIFLNKTCYRGMFREGPNGFNVPYGHGKSTMVEHAHLKRLGTLIRDVIFICCDFAVPIMNDTIAKGDFVYIDPPRVSDLDIPASTFSHNDFGMDRHKLLYNLCGAFSENGVNMMMTNLDTPFVRQYFQIYDYCVRVIEYNRHVNSKNQQDNMREVLIKNYNYIS